LFEHYGNVYDIKSQYLAILDRNEFNYRFSIAGKSLLAIARMSTTRLTHFATARNYSMSLAVVFSRQTGQINHINMVIIYAARQYLTKV
jgi:hypothetical protein